MLVQCNIKILLFYHMQVVISCAGCNSLQTLLKKIGITVNSWIPLASNQQTNKKPWAIAVTKNLCIFIKGSTKPQWVKLTFQVCVLQYKLQPSRKSFQYHGTIPQMQYLPYTKPFLPTILILVRMFYRY